MLTHRQWGKMVTLFLAVVKITIMEQDPVLSTTSLLVECTDQDLMATVWDQILTYIILIPLQASLTIMAIQFHSMELHIILTNFLLHGQACMERLQ